MSKLSECKIPVIVYTHGFTIGGAIDLISAADIRICSKDCIFQIAEVSIGMAADLGTI